MLLNQKHRVRLDPSALSATEVFAVKLPQRDKGYNKRMSTHKYMICFIETIVYGVQVLSDAVFVLGTCWSLLLQSSQFGATSLL